MDPIISTMKFNNRFSILFACMFIMLQVPGFLNSGRLHAQECTRGNCKQGFGTYVYANGSRYTGEFRGGLKHGKGVYYYANGNKYLGEWKEDLRQGEGKLNYANGDVFTGQFQADFMEGQGTMLFSHGDRYIGSWKKNKPNGKGIYYFQTGERYEGDFVDARFEGKGMLYYKNGSFFSGEWRASKKQGQGLLQELNGRSVSGIWENDKLIRTIHPSRSEESPVGNKPTVQKELASVDQKEEIHNTKDKLQSQANSSEEDDYFNKIMGVSEQKADEPVVTDNSDVRRFFGEEDKAQNKPQEPADRREATGRNLAEAKPDSVSASESSDAAIQAFFGEDEKEHPEHKKQTVVRQEIPEGKPSVNQANTESAADKDHEDIQKFFGDKEDPAVSSAHNEQVLGSPAKETGKTEGTAASQYSTRQSHDDMDSFSGEEGEEHRANPNKAEVVPTTDHKPSTSASSVPTVRTEEKVKPTEEREKPQQEKPIAESGKPTDPKPEEHLPNCNAEYCAEGRGIFTYGDGSRYVGTFLSGEPAGKGICYYANGDRYKGSWKNHAPDGEGVMYFSSGLVYAAIWSQGKAIQELSRKKEFVFDNKVPVDHSKEVKIWAVIVGIARYEHMPSLKYSDDDAYKIYAFLKSPEGGALKDDQIRVLIDEEANRNAILQAINQVFMRADENDVVMLYYSGHGLDGTFLPVDYDGYQNQLKHDEIRNLLDKCKAKNKVVYIDACYSGSLLATKGPYSNSLLEFYDELSKSKGGTAFLMSSKSKEYSLEDGGLRQGVFSHFLIRGLKGESDRNQDKIISLKELFEYVYKNVRDYTANVQSPMIAGDYDEEMPVGFIRQD